MQTVTSTWRSLFAAKHKTEYRFFIDGVEYKGAAVKGTPLISKKIMDKPGIGQVCTGSMSFSVYPKSNNIPKAAAVNAECRLVSPDGLTVSEWLPQGKYLISNRTGKAVVTFNCLDLLVKAGVKYRELSSFTEWPQSMSAVVNEICQIMGVQLDPRTIIKTGTDYVVSYPNDDVLISEVLSMIASAHGGNWIMTDAGKLRMVVLASPTSTAVQTLGNTHKGYTVGGKTQTVSRVILTDEADNDFTAGNDTGLILGARCNYATQRIANDLCGSSQSTLRGVTYEPYSVACAYLNPAVELGDTVSVTDESGTAHLVVLQSITADCTVAYTCALAAKVEGETEQEFPYVTAKDLALDRALKTDQTYFGNRINRAEGFVSELVVNSEIKARMTANASLFSMQSADDQGDMVDRIYFDTATGKYVISADVTVQGAVTFEDLSTAGQTVINGNNITTGIIKDASGNLIINLDNGTFSIGGDNLETVLSLMSGQIASRITEGEAESLIDQAVGSISMSVSGSDGTTTFQLLQGSAVLDTETVDLHVKSINITGTITADAVKANTSITTPTITGGTINIGSGNFSVSSNGTVTLAGVASFNPGTTSWYGSEFSGKGVLMDYLEIGHINDNNNTPRSNNWCIKTDGTAYFTKLKGMAGNWSIAADGTTSGLKVEAVFGA